MDHTEKQLIHGLFDRLEQTERTAPPRDGEAESFIRERIGSQPGAPYFMAQTILVQEQALAAAKARIDALESGTAAGSQQSAAERGGLFGNAAGANAAPARTASPAWGQRGNASVPSAGMRRGAGGGGGGFLAGAAQTALGVAGGVMLGSMLGSLFAGDDSAGEAGGDEVAAAEPEADAGGFEDAGFDDGGGGDFGGFDDI